MAYAWKFYNISINTGRGQGMWHRKPTQAELWMQVGRLSTQAHRLREGHMVQQLEQCHRAVTWELQARTQLAVCLSTLQLREAKRCDCLWTALCSRTWKPIEMGQSLFFFLRQNLKVAQASFAILLPHTPKHWNHICKPHFSTLFTDDTVGAAWAYQDKTPGSVDVGKTWAALQFCWPVLSTTRVRRGCVRATGSCLEAQRKSD